MYINVQYLFWGIIGLAALVSLIYLIITLKKLINLINNINGLINTNKENFNKFCTCLPEISQNIEYISDSVKDLTDVASEVTADAIVAKENFIANYETLKDIINIILSIFSKR